MSDTTDEIVNWYFESGYKDLAKNKKPTATHQTSAASAHSRIMNVANLMEVTPVEALTFLYAARQKAKQKAKFDDTPRLIKENK